jgi:glucose-6-phosphate 1-epimerase
MTPPVVDGINGMPRLELTHDSGSIAHVYLGGAQLTSWIPVGWHDMLYLSRRARFAPGVPTRGGIPVIFPQFADNGPLPRHGWLRTVEWKVSGAASDSEDATHATLFTEDTLASRKIWPHAYRAELDVSIGENALTVALSIFNTGAEGFSFTSAFHNYFSLGDVRESHVEGLRGVRYLDKTDGFTEKTENADKIAIDRMTDRIYKGAPGRVVLHDHASGAFVEIAANGFPDIVLWNPWAEGASQIDDMPDDDYLSMICIEPALAVTPFALAPGEHWTGAQRLTVRGS